MADAVDIELATQAAQAVREAEALRAVALRRRREAAQHLREQGKTLAEIGEAIGLPRQRVQKILDGNAEPKYKRLTKEEKAQIEAQRLYAEMLARHGGRIEL